MTPRAWRGEDFFVEFYVVDAVDATRGVVTGVNAMMLYDPDGNTLDRVGAAVAWAVAADPEFVIRGETTHDGAERIAVWTLEDDRFVFLEDRTWPSRIVHLDRAGDHVVVVDRRGVLSVLSLGLAQTGALDIEDVTCAAFLDADTVLVGHGSALSLVDRRSGEVLASADLVAPPRDVDVDEDNVVVALGGGGVQAFKTEGTTLEPRGHLDIPALRVSVDGQDAWLASWNALGLVWLGDGGPIQVGQENPNNVAMDVGASGGRAWVGDWLGHGVVDRNPGLTGPELDIPPVVTGVKGESAPLRVANAGTHPLEVTVLEQTLTLEPGGRGLFVVPVGEGIEDVPFTSNDLDEPEGSIRVWPTTLGTGAAHPDFTVQAFDPQADEATYPWTLADQLDRPVFLVYWAEY